MAEAGDYVPSPLAMRAARELADQFVDWGFDRPATVTCRGGSMQLEWHRGGVDVEVYVETDGSMNFWYSGPRMVDLLKQALG